MVFALSTGGWAAIILFAVVWIALAFWPARVAHRKGHSFIGYFILSLIFFPLALILAYLVRDRRGRGRRHEAPGTSHFQMREKMFSIGDDYWIETDRGDRAFKVNGKALRVRDTLVIEDPSGAELYKIQEKKLNVRDTMHIDRGGDTIATVKKAMITPVRERFSIDNREGQDLEAKGNVVDHEYKIERGGDTVAEVSKRWFRARDTYGIEVAPGEDTALMLAVTVCIDRMTHD